MSDHRWLDDRQQRAWRGHLAVQTRLHAELNRRLQSDSGLSLVDFDVLVALSEHEGVSMRSGELAEALQWEKSRLSHHLSRMQRRGLVERRECPDDARGAFVVLTAEGRRTIERAAPAHAEAVHALVFDGLEDHQVRAWTEVSAAILGRVDGTGAEVRR